MDTYSTEPNKSILWFSHIYFEYVSHCLNALDDSEQLQCLMLRSPLMIVTTFRGYGPFIYHIESKFDLTTNISFPSFNICRARFLLWGAVYIIDPWTLSRQSKQIVLSNVLQSFHRDFWEEYENWREYDLLGLSYWWRVGARCGYSSELSSANC